jgi:hypothetical protein
LNHDEVENYRADKQELGDTEEAKFANALEFLKSDIEELHSLIPDVVNGIYVKNTKLLPRVFVLLDTLYDFFTHKANKPYLEKLDAHIKGLIEWCEDLEKVIRTLEIEEK